MDDRLKLHEELCEILGTRFVYFQAPSSELMKYPCIRYEKAPPNLKRANNQIYNNTNRYKVFVIDEDPDSEIPNKILKRYPMCSIDSFYVADNLNHTVLTLYH